MSEGTPVMRPVLLSADEVQQQLALLRNWTLVDGAIEKQFLHDDFAHALIFVNAVAWIAEREDHHPDVQLSYGRCLLRWCTHSASGLTMLDFRCAAEVDALMKS